MEPTPPTGSRSSEPLLGWGWSQTCTAETSSKQSTCILASGLEVVNPVPEVGHHEVLGLDHPLLGLHRLLELLVLLRDGAAPGNGALKLELETKAI